MRNATVVSSDPLPSKPDLPAVEAAHRRIASSIAATPLIESALGSNILLKLEALNPTGSFKIRGASNALMARLDEAHEKGVICCSTGNHGRALAYAAAKNNVPATICISQLVPPSKVAALKALGADVRIVGMSQDDAQVEVDRLVEQDGRIEIPPFDHPDVIAGQGTIALELLQQRPDLTAIAVPLSGGGLAGGIALAAKATKPDIRIIGISMDRGAAMAASIAAGQPVEVEEVPSLADSLGGGIGLANRHSFDLCRRLLDDVILVNESEIYRGLRYLLAEERLLAEGGSAVAHAAILSGKLEPGNGPMALIISGRNAEPDHVAKVLAGEPLQLSENVTVQP